MTEEKRCQNETLQAAIQAGRDFVGLITFSDFAIAMNSFRDYSILSCHRVEFPTEAYYEVVLKCLRRA